METLAIITEYVPAAGSKGARIKAKTGCETAKIFFPYPNELSGRDCHEAAAAALLQKIVGRDSGDEYRILNVACIKAGYVFFIAIHRASVDRSVEP